MLCLYSFRSLLTCVLFGFTCSAWPLYGRGAAKQFRIYAFGANISGLQVFYADGIAKIGDPTQSNAAEVVPVYFTTSSTEEYTWLAHADSSNATWSTKALYLADGRPGEVGFTSSDSTGKLTDVWWHYGHYVMVKVDGANFYANPIAGATGWYTLSWTNSGQGGLDQTLVTLRTIEPSTGSLLS
ncbi:hypothetical protein PEBR_09232 [Penicillium brasilianum]|uniref:Uncharacterized protein n=1 Tax=Penicillium brasilianum TaxID=104259 RepID=A0A1S9S1Q0_PENBI|nr:hypothetical protein PEBR_09232 [Penicillium brasilianum]